MATKETIGIIPSGAANARENSAVLQTRRDEMSNAKEFGVRNVEAARSGDCRPGPGTCISTCKCACIIPPKCGPTPPRPNRR